jgi:hypothetical protein
LRVVRVDTVDREVDIPVLVIAPGWLDKLRVPEVDDGK